MIINNVGYSHNLQMDIAKINAIVNTQQFWFIVNQFVFDSDNNNNKNNNVQSAQIHLIGQHSKNSLSPRRFIEIYNFIYIFLSEIHRENGIR